jgi:hypothetical protein
LRGAQIFTKLHLRNAYHLIRIKEDDEYNTAFRTGYWQFESRVRLFGFTNAPSTFQAHLEECQQPYIDYFAVCYLDDILIYSTNKQQAEEQFRKVQEQLRELGLYGKADQCRFGVSEVGFLRFVISPDGIAMESDRISTIEDWPTPESVRDVQVLLGFTHFYRQFIRKYSKVTMPISDLLKKAKNPRMPKQVIWEWTRDAELAFWK